MNLCVVLHVIIGASIVIARPVDVNNDDRPLINYISPHELEDLVIIIVAVSKNNVFFLLKLSNRNVIVRVFDCNDLRLLNCF